MKQLVVEAGGRPFNWDDLLTLQAELTAAVQAQFLGNGPFVLAGCAVSGPAGAATIAAGVLCLDGQLLRYPGNSNVALPAQFQAGAAVSSDLRPYETGGSKSCMREVPAVVVAPNPRCAGGEFLPVDTWGAKTWAHVQRAQAWEVGDIKWSAIAHTADYDAAGIGKPGTSAWGWALCDGQNNRADLRGNFIVGHDPAQADYDLVGKTGGAPSVTLDLSQIPRHDHTGGVGQARFAWLDGKVTLNSDTNDTATEPNLGRVAEIQPQGGGKEHENRPPFYVLAARQWVGY